jgi:hypothetical protein
MPPALFSQSVNVFRRTSTPSRDALNNPVYGTPTSGAGWSQIYTSMPCKLAFSSKAIQFAQTGERPEPSGIMYFGSAYSLLEEDRVVTVTGLPTSSSTIEYVVVGIVPAYSTPNTVDHYEAVLSLPV